MTYTVGLHLQDRYNIGYRQYNLTVHKGNAQDNTTPVKWHHRKKLAIHVDVFVSVAVRGASFRNTVFILNVVLLRSKATDERCQAGIG